MTDTPTQNGNGRPPLDAKDEFLLKLGRMILQAGAGWNCGVVVQVADESGAVQSVQTTPAQLIHNLTEAVKDNTEAVDNNSEIAEDALEDAPKQRKRKRR